MLGDALIELGDYDEGFKNFEQMAKYALADEASVEIRRARVAQLRGDLKEARTHALRSLGLARSAAVPARETVAWCEWQLSEIAFMSGDYKESEKLSRDALKDFPDYYRALGSLARSLAAQGNLNGAIESYERAAKRLPDPVFVAALGDLYKLAGRDADANAQYALVESIAHLTQLSGQLYNRQLALFYADHDMKPDDAYSNAAREYEMRRDIYGADALAWAALKAGKIDEAQHAMKEALKLNTQDARLFYHAGMIAKAAGDNASAKNYLKRALALSPKFDPVQSAHAEAALKELS